MKCVRVTNEVDAYCVIHRIEQQCDIVEVYGGGVITRNEIFESFLDNAIIYKFMSDNYRELYATAIIERFGDDVGLIHFAMFKPCHILRGWKLLIDDIHNEFNELVAYIDDEREDIYKLLVMLGFKMNLKDGLYYGQSKKSSWQGNRWRGIKAESSESSQSDESSSRSGERVIQLQTANESR